MAQKKKTADSAGPTTSAAATPLGQPVLVTTDKRGVFFGYLKGEPGPTVTLTQARNCLYWSNDVKGFVGLAVTGPTSGCRIGPAAPEMVLMGVTSVSKVTAEAAVAWEKAPWSS